MICDLAIMASLNIIISTGGRNFQLISRRVECEHMAPQSRYRQSASAHLRIRLRRQTHLL